MSSGKSKSERQYNGQKKKYNRTNNDLLKTTQKPKHRTTGTPLKTGGELRCLQRVSSSCFTCDHPTSYSRTKSFQQFF